MLCLGLQLGGQRADTLAAQTAQREADAHPSTDSRSSDGWPGSALHVFDGDTLQLPDGSRLRLDGIDTPETGRPFADAATEAVRELLASGRWFLHPEQPPRDVYGRLLGGLRNARGLDLGETLLARGLAWIYREKDPRLLALQAAAVDARRGVHSGLDALPGPFVVTAQSFHRPDCSLVRRRGRQLPWSASAAPLLKAGRAACRRCMRWPPRRMVAH
ncbi:MAG: nuclease [Planctomycetota bacterium]|nr:MAG: nuclease [Planctomycetota bacterium]